MLDIKKIHKNPEWFKEKLALRDIDSDIIDRLLQVDDNRKQCIQKIDDLKFKRRNLEKKFVQDNSGQSLEVLKEVKRAIDILEKDLDKYTKEFDDLMYSLPNVPLADVPEGEKDKIIVEKGKKPLFTFIPKDYLSISEQLDLINIEDASNVSGSRFSFIKNELVFLQFALIKYVYDKFCQKYNFVPILPPFFIKSEYFKAMGYIDIEADKNETYYLPDDDLYLIGTAEHILGAMNANKIFQEEQLPQRFLGFSSCFRREAGSYGKDTKGILRSHQFDKIEMLSICTESQSLKEQDLFIDLETKLMEDLVLPYRIVQTAVKNLSRPSARSFDIECWMPGQNDGKGEYRETHSNSNCTDFQTRRLNIKYKNIKGDSQFAYMLNGTFIALGRIMIAIIENYQTKTGSIKIPTVLWPYMNGIKEIGNKHGKTKFKLF